jgi:hypothetical protein
MSEIADACKAQVALTIPLLVYVVVFLLGAAIKSYFGDTGVILAALGYAVGYMTCSVRRLT